MTRTRTLTAALALAFLGPVLAAGCVDSAPPSTQLTSPFIGWTSPTGRGIVQEANLNACSLAGGPVTVTILDVENAPASSLSAAATITLGSQAFDGSPTHLTSIGDSWTSIPLPANSCFAVRVYDNAGPESAPSFRFRIDW